MVAVSWYGAVAFCNWLSEMEGVTPVMTARANWPLKESRPRATDIGCQQRRNEGGLWDGSGTGCAPLQVMNWSEEQVQLHRRNAGKSVGLIERGTTSPVGGSMASL